MIYEDVYGNLMHASEVERLAPFEIAERGFHLYDPREIRAYLWFLFYFSHWIYRMSRSGIVCFLPDLLQRSALDILTIII